MTDIFFDLASSEQKDYYDQVISNVASKQIRVGYNEIFPSNHVVTLAVNQESKLVPDVTKWGFQGFKKGQPMINVRAETVEKRKLSQKPSEKHVASSRYQDSMNGIPKSENYYFLQGIVPFFT